MIEISLREVLPRVSVELNSALVQISNDDGKEDDKISLSLAVPAEIRCSVGFRSMPLNLSLSPIIKTFPLSSSALKSFGRVIFP